MYLVSKFKTVLLTLIYIYVSWLVFGVPTVS